LIFILKPGFKYDNRYPLKGEDFHNRFKNQLYVLF